MSLSFAFCAGPAASLGAWPWPDDPREAPMTSDPLRACLQNAQGAMRAGEFDAATGWFRHASALDETLVLARLGAAICLVQAGRDAEGAAELAQAYDASGKPGEVDATLARLYAMLGHRDAACFSAELAVAHDQAWAQSLREDPAFRPLRDHPMFLQALGEL